MEDEEKIKKLQARLKQLEELQARQQDFPTATPEKEDLFRKVFEYANDGIIIHDHAGQIYEVNQAMYKRLGYTHEEMLKMSLQDLVAPEFSERIRARVSRLEQDGVAIFESADMRKDGTALPVEVSARVIEYNGQKLIQSIVRDIHERKTAERVAQHALQEREILLEEIRQRIQLHHDLYIMGLGLLKHHEETALPTYGLENQIRRIKALRYVQGRIYSHKNVTRIDFSKIASGLVKHLLTLYSVDVRRISCDLEIGDITMDIRRAASCAQILIELLGNAFMHAFPGDKKGRVSVAIDWSAEEGYTLVCSDDGIGIPSDLSLTSTETLGMKQVRDLVTQLDGQLCLENAPGAQITIQFP